MSKNYKHPRITKTKSCLKNRIQKNTTLHFQMHRTLFVLMKQCLSLATECIAQIEYVAMKNRK